MGKFSKGGKSALPEAKANTPPAAPKSDPARPGQQGVEDHLEEDAAALAGHPPAKAPVEQPKPEEQQTQVRDEEPRVDEKGQRRNPWDLVNNYRSKNRELLKEVDELRSRSGTDNELPAPWKAKWEAIEKRNKELEDEIGFVNYRKSKDFVEQYEKPYQTAWQDAIQALSGLKVKFQRTDPQTQEITMQERDLTPHDIVTLAGMEAAAARAEIKARFPDDWVEVKTHIDKVRALSNAQNKALEEHQGKGGEWQKNQQEAMQRAMQEMQATNKAQWREILDEHTKKYEFLRPVEGETERNAKLEKAVEFVESALSVNAFDPRLNPAQRTEVLRKHAALRNRAIGYSVLSHENKSLKSKVAELEKSLKEFQASQPSSGEGRGQDGQGLQMTSMDSVVAGLSKYAR